MKLGICVRMERDLYFIKERYLKYFKEFEIIFIYPNSELYKFCDGFVIIGGGDINPKYYGDIDRGSDIVLPQVDKLDFFILDYAVKNKKPLFGICRGLQVINVYFKGTLIQDLKTHLNVFHTIRLKTNNKLLPLVTTVNSYHHQVVKKLGEGLLPLYKADDGVIEAIIHEELPILGVQFHPEMHLETLFYQQILAFFKAMMVFKKNF